MALVIHTSRFIKGFSSRRYETRLSPKEMKVMNIAHSILNTSASEGLREAHQLRKVYRSCVEMVAR